MSKFLTIALWLGCIVHLSAQQSTAFLSQKVTDLDYTIASLQSEYLESHNFSSPWMRDLDFRFRTSSGFSELEEYRMRLGLINPMEIKANSDLNKMMSSQLSLKLKASINDVLLGRYELLLQTYFIQKQQIYTEQKREFLQKQYDLIIGTNTSYNDLIKLEEQMTKDEISAMDDLQKIELINRQSPELAKVQWYDEEIISIDLALNVLDSISLADYVGQLAQLKLQIKEQELKLKKAESRSNLGFVQGQYEINDKDLLQDHLGFQVGVSIPVFNKDRPDLQRKKLALIENQVEDEFKTTDRDLKLDNMMLNLETCLQQFELVKSKYSRIADYENAMNQSAIDLDSYTRLINYKYYLLEKQLELECSFLGYYLKILHFQGVLGDTPRRNFLSNRIEFFELQN